MDIRRKNIERLTDHLKGVVRVAAMSPGEAPEIEQALAGDLKQNAGQTNIKRAIPEDYKFDPKSLKPLAKMLWAMSVSLGHALSAHKAFVRLKSSTISPDGMLGGRGYVMAVKDVRTMLHDACEALSALCDTIHDEINGPHWDSKLSMLEKQDADQIQSLMGEAQRYLDDPEGESDEDEEEAEKSGHAGWHHPAVDKANKGKKDPKSQFPNGGDKETGPQAQPLRHDMRKSPSEKQASTAVESSASWARRVEWLDRNGPPLSVAHRVAARFLLSNSSLPVETMPGGPRVDHLDRGDEDQQAPYGTYGQPPSEEERELKDTWQKDDGFGHEYNYPSDFDNDLHEKQADDWSALVGTSAVPDSNSDKTPTEAWDFGIGDGNGDDAHGQGAGGYGEGNPGAPDSNPGGGTGNMGVYGPQSGIPKDPGGKVNPDESDSNLTIENEIGGKGRSAAEDPWTSHPPSPGTIPFGTPEFQEATHEEPPEMSLHTSPREANADKPWGQDHDGWVMGLDPATLVALGSTKQAWYDGVYDYEHPIDPVGGPDSIDPVAGAALPGGPQEPYVGFGLDNVGMFMEPDENFDWRADLPGDDNAGVARTDYYDGPKPINMQDSAPSTVGQTKLPGEQMPAKLTPTTQRPSHNQEFMFGTGELPGDGTTVNFDYDRDLGPDQTTTYEQQNTPYIKWDDNTHEMRPDPIHQRDPVQGPYVHNDLTERPSNG